jgi:hypothetical protein
MPAGSGLLTGISKVTTAGTAVALITAAELETLRKESNEGKVRNVLGVWIEALSTNTTTNMIVGDSAAKVAAGNHASPTRKGVLLEKEKTGKWFEVGDLRTIFIDAETNGDGVSWTAVLA